MAAPSLPPIKILMIHGYTQSGPLFRAKTRALEKSLQKAFPAGCTLVYPTGPLRLRAADVPFDTSALPTSTTEDGEEEPDTWAWWRRKDQADGDNFEYAGLEKGFATIAEVLKTEGPFDGVVGFSQGGCATGMIASLLEPDRKAAFDKAQEKGGMAFPTSFVDSGHPPLKFAAIYSGFAPTDNALYKAFYEPKLITPMLHFIGSLDTVVEEKRSLALVNACEKSEGNVVYHPGGHFVPAAQKQYVGALVGFIREAMVSANGEKKEESAEDMDVPF